MTKSAFIAIVGRPNVGKSTILNALVGEKVAIVTPKPQTTRTRITGILTEGETQLVFFDTPGVHRPRTRLSEYMVKKIGESVDDVDLAVLVTDAQGPVRDTERELCERFRSRNIPAILVLNKIDLLTKKELMLEKIAAFSAIFEFDQLLPLSAVNADGLDTLRGLLLSSAQDGPHFFDDDAYTDQPERVLCAEIIREKLLMALRDEIPHGTAVGIESMKDRPQGNIVDIHAVIYCEKASHKGMIIGKQGEMLKRVATQSRVELEGFLDAKVNLQCWVKIKEDWRNRAGSIREFGYE